jgi:hypothetical protein
MWYRMIELRDALLANSDAIEKALQAAEAERDSLRLKGAELDEWIERARITLGRVEPAKQPLTLHEAMQVVLRQHRAGLTAPALADELNRRGLYRQKNGKSVEAGQVHARAGSYKAMFRRQDGRIVLRGQEEPR